MASPYSLGANTQMPPVDPEMVKFGLDAIKKGLVSPQQALAAGQQFSPYLSQSPEINAGIANQQKNLAQANQEHVMEQVGATAQPSRSTASEAVQPPSLPALPSAAPKSGKTFKVDAKNTAEQKTTTNKTIPLGDDQYAIMDKRAKEQLESLTAGQNGLEDMLKMEQQRPRSFDWGTFDRWAAALNGHPMAPPKVESEDERSKRIMDYAQKIQQDRKAIADTYLSSIQKQKGGTVINMNGASQSASAENKSQDPTLNQKGSPASQVLSFARQTNTETKDMRARGELIHSALKILTSGNPTEQNSLPALAARILEGTVRPQLAVIAKEGGDSSGWGRLEQGFTRLATGKVDAENVGQYALMFKDLNDQLKNEQSAFQRRAKVTANKIGLNQQEYEDMVGQQWLAPNEAATNTMLENTPRPKNVSPIGRGPVAPPSGNSQSNASAPVERTTADGKTALFDPVTKKFLRYK